MLLICPSCLLWSIQMYFVVGATNLISTAVILVLSFIKLLYYCIIILPSTFPLSCWLSSNAVPSSISVIHSLFSSVSSHLVFPPCWVTYFLTCCSHLDLGSFPFTSSSKSFLVSLFVHSENLPFLSYCYLLVCFPVYLTLNSLWCFLIPSLGSFFRKLSTRLLLLLY
jgi:hypothetical protein